MAQYQEELYLSPTKMLISKREFEVSVPKAYVLGIKTYLELQFWTLISTIAA